MSKAVVDKLVMRDSGEDLYEDIVEAWEAVVQENTDELHLVTAPQRESWLRFRQSYTEQIIALGEAGANGSWNMKALEGVISRLQGATHKDRSTLEAEFSDKSREERSKHTKGLVNRLKNLLG